LRTSQMRGTSRAGDEHAGQTQGQHAGLHAQTTCQGGDLAAPSVVTGVVAVTARGQADDHTANHGNPPATSGRLAPVRHTPEVSAHVASPATAASLANRPQASKERGASYRHPLPTPTSFQAERRYARAGRGKCAPQFRRRGWRLTRWPAAALAAAWTLRSLRPSLSLVRSGLRCAPTSLARGVLVLTSGLPR
jgi:hypothetical protein